MDNNMKKRWISLYVENQVGVLSKISGLFSGKCYNLDRSDSWNNRRPDRFQNDNCNSQR